MKQRLLSLFLLVMFAGCESDNLDLSDPLSSARGFIEASLRGDYVKAEKYMLNDSINHQYLDNLRAFSKKLTPLEREYYRDADIIIDSTRATNDSTDIVYYKNTYKKEATRLKLRKRGDKWKVDFKYTFADDLDALPEPLRDSR